MFRSNVLASPLVNVKIGFENDPVVTNEPVSTDPPPPDRDWETSQQLLLL